MENRERIKELLMSQHPEDVILGIIMANNIYGEEYFTSMKDSQKYENNVIITPHNLKKVGFSDAMILFDTYSIAISSVNIWWLNIHECHSDNIIYDGRTK